MLTIMMNGKSNREVKSECFTKPLTNEINFSKAFVQTSIVKSSYLILLNLLTGVQGFGSHLSARKARNLHGDRVEKLQIFLH